MFGLDSQDSAPPVLLPLSLKKIFAEGALVRVRFVEKPELPPLAFQGLCGAGSSCDICVCIYILYTHDTYI